MRLAAGRAEDEDLVGIRSKGLTGDGGTADGIDGTSAGRVKIEFAAVTRHRSRVCKREPQVAEGLVGLRMGTLHLETDTVCEVVILLDKDGFPDCPKILLRIFVVAIPRIPGPKGVVVELQQFFIRRCVLAATASKDHRSQASVADWQRVYP